jgi:hypothetical protein
VFHLTLHFDRLPGQVCRLLERLAGHYIEHWGGSLRCEGGNIPVQVVRGLRACTGGAAKAFVWLLRFWTHDIRMHGPFSESFLEFVGRERVFRSKLKCCVLPARRGLSKSSSWAVSLNMPRTTASGLCWSRTDGRVRSASILP